MSYWDTSAQAQRRVVIVNCRERSTIFNATLKVVAQYLNATETERVVLCGSSAGYAASYLMKEVGFRLKIVMRKRGEVSMHQAITTIRSVQVIFRKRWWGKDPRPGELVVFY